MCDKVHFERLREDQEELEVRLMSLERSTIQMETTTKQLVASVATLNRTVYGVLMLSFLIMLFALVYGALGDRGFHAVADKVAPVHVKP